MKLTKKKILALALVVCMLAIVSVGSLAWFSHEDSVKNDFYFTDSETDDPDKIFSVNVWEQNDPEDDGNTYINLLPGDTLQKEVYVKNTGYYSQYVRVTVTVSDAALWQEIFGVSGTEAVALDKLVNGIDNTKLYGMQSTVQGEDLVYVLYYKDTLVSDAEFLVFESVSIPTNMDRNQAARMNANFEIHVKAEAVQTEHVGESVFDAFATVGKNPQIDTAYVSSFEEMQAAIDKHNNITVVLVNDVSVS